MTHDTPTQDPTHRQRREIARWDDTTGGLVELLADAGGRNATGVPDALQPALWAMTRSDLRRADRDVVSGSTLIRRRNGVDPDAYRSEERSHGAVREALDGPGGD